MGPDVSRDKGNENRISVSQSVSLTRSEKRISPPKKTDKQERKRKNPPEVSPKLSVLERKSRFERVQEKYRNQRCLKENKEKTKSDRSKLKRDKPSKNNSEDSDESIASMLKKIHADITVMKTDLKENSSQISSINSKVTAIEKDNARVESENNLKFESIRYDMILMETSVTAKVINQLDPKISSMRNELREDLCADMRRLVQEEVQLQKFKERKEDPNDAQESEEDETDNEDGAEKRKKTKIKK